MSKLSWKCNCLWSESWLLYEWCSGIKDVSYLILGNSHELWINLLSAKRMRNLERMIIIEAMVKSEYGHRQEREFLESKVEVKGYWQWVKAWAIAIGNDKEHWQIGEWVVESWQILVRLEARTRAIGQYWEDSRERGTREGKKSKKDYRMGSLAIAYM